MTSWEYEDAGQPADDLRIESVTLIPDPPARGSEVKMLIKGHVQNAIEDGAYYDLTVKLGLIKLLHKQVDLFEEIRSGVLSVSPDPAGGPIKPGDVELTHTVKLPKEVPPAKFKLEIRGVTAAEDNLLALNLKVDLIG
ncbi:ML domain-containing protein [Streptomyces fagopyri]|uniref:ML domain-containing protein n=1 Tax=Streptomyces fagopyri TaxID=2662397 RepID=UPI00340FD57B